VLIHIGKALSGWPRVARLESWQIRGLVNILAKNNLVSQRTVAVRMEGGSCSSDY
jgi:hypothetical protein